MTENRLDKVRRKLQQDARLDGMLITNMTNVLYLSGFSGSSAALLLTGKRDYLITDFRYVEQAAKESPHLTLVEHKTTLIHAAVSKVKRLKLKLLGIESSSINLDQFNVLKEGMGDVELIPVTGFVEEFREVKDEGEIEKIVNAIKVAERALGRVRKSIRPGVPEKDLADMLDHYMRRCGAQRNAFDTIVAAGGKSSLPHAKPGREKVTRGDMVLFDWGAHVGFYNSDLTRVVFTDKITRQAKKVFQIVFDAQRFAIEKIKPGVVIREVDRAARGYIEKKGFGKQFGHGLGHGVGLEVHESPAINRRNKKPLKAGMVVTIEPGIYLPDWGGIRIEDMALVTEDGCRVLSGFPKQIVL